jgi:hypothetical protein
MISVALVPSPYFWANSQAPASEAAISTSSPK